MQKKGEIKRTLEEQVDALVSHVCAWFGQETLLAQGKHPRTILFHHQYWVTRLPRPVIHHLSNVSPRGLHSAEGKQAPSVFGPLPPPPCPSKLHHRNEHADLRKRSPEILCLSVPILVLFEVHLHPCTQGVLWWGQHTTRTANMSISDPVGKDSGQGP